MKILLIDHQSYRIQSLARGLRTEGHHVFEARTLLEALAYIRRRGVHVGLIITDCSIRVRCNPEFLQTVLERSLDIQIVTMTPKTKWNQGLNPVSWVTHYLNKPYTIDELTNLVETMAPTPTCLDALGIARLGSYSPQYHEIHLRMYPVENYESRLQQDLPRPGTPVNGPSWRELC